jgi:hypothetical protein
MSTDGTLPSNLRTRGNSVWNTRSDGQKMLSNSLLNLSNALSKSSRSSNALYGTTADADLGFGLAGTISFFPDGFSFFSDTQIHQTANWQKRS